MITSFRILIATALLSQVAMAAPVGICLHAYGPDAPPEKIECFEYEKVERAGSDYRFFPRADRSVIVTGYRFRSAIPYKPGLAPTHPDFDKLLKLYEETARATPSTRAFLNPKILVMRAQVAQMVDQKEKVAGLSTITLADGSQLRGCTMRKIEDGSVSIMHQDGISKVSLEELDATEKKALNATAEDWSLEDPSVTPKDSSGMFSKIVFKNGVLLKDATFKEVSGSDLVFLADGKSVSVPFDQFPGELSVLGEDVAAAFVQTKEETQPEPIVASSDGETKKNDELLGENHAGEPFMKLGDEASKEGWASKELKLALKYYEQAEEYGHPGANKKIRLVLFWLAEESEDKPETAELYRKSAERGSAHGQWGLAKCLYTGYGVEVDMVESAKWAQKAAEHGHLDAQMGLADSYLRGAGVEKNPKTAGEWYRMAAERGHPDAQYELGFLIQIGNVLPEPGENAFKWFEKAAYQQKVEAQFSMGLGYEDGSVLPKDIVRAYMWLSLASARQKNTLLDAIAYNPKNVLNDVSKKMTDEQVRAAKKLVSEWKPKYPIRWASRQIEELRTNDAD